MDLPGDKHKSNPKNVTHEAFIKSLQSQRRVLGRVIKNEEQLKEIVDQLVAMGATLGEHGEIFDSHGIRIRKLDDKVTGLQKRVSKVEKRKPRRGPRGKTGKRGAAGRDGLDGSDGAPGASGAQGERGAQGDSGASGGSGPSGSDGVDGSDGSQGGSGPSGSRGADGSQGGSGPSGSRGADGSQGGSGPSGARGADGSQGGDGVDGSDGSQGGTGPSGSRGSDGSQGGTGPSGARGADGQGPDKSQNPDFDWDTPGGGSPSGGRKYEGTREDDLVDEEIDERILRIIGLDDTVGIDYATYRTLLREKMAEGRMGTTTMSSEEIELITEEWRRVKGKVGRFKVRKGNAEGDDGAPAGGGGQDFSDSFFNKKPPAPPGPPEADVGGEGGEGGPEGIAGHIAAIRTTVESIAEIVANSHTLIRNDIARRKRDNEKASRGAAETKMESPIKGLQKMAGKALAPVQSAFDRIIKFFTTILLGKLLLKFVEWFGNPQNKGKIEALGRFIGDWWPTLLGAFVLFATPLGGVIKFVIGKVLSISGWMLKKGIPAAMRAIAKNPWAAGAIALGGLAAFGVSKLSGDSDKEESSVPSVTPRGDRTDEENVQLDAMWDDSNKMADENNIDSGGNKIEIGDRVGYSGGGLVEPLTQGIQLFNDGGEITPQTGQRITGAEPDTQLIAAQPGEVMMSKGAVQKYGADTLLGMNAAAGGSNVPEMAENVQKMSGGGLVAGPKPSGVKVDLGGKDSETVDLTPPPAASDGADGTAGADGAAGQAGQTGAQGLAGGMLKGIGSGLKTMGGIAANVMDPFGIGRGLLGKAKDAIGGAIGAVKDKMSGPTVTVNANLVPSTLPVLEERITKLEMAPPTPPPEPPTPPGKGGFNITDLPPQVIKDGGGGSTLTGSREIKDFPVVFENAHRKNCMELYGIMGVG